MKYVFPSRSCNEVFARTAVSAFASQLDPTLDELIDIKTAVSEAVTNCIVHAYGDSIGLIYISVKLLCNDRLEIVVRDRGCGIPDVKAAMEPTFTTSADSERAGLGFSVMAAFTDSLRVRSTQGRGTAVTMIKTIGKRQTC
ncbi:MAG: anti-sigma F factor [Oscillospiraceae bacterium]